MDPNWIKYYNAPNELICDRCGDTHSMPTGSTEIKIYLNILVGFADRHENCKEPKS